jgi:hypothetical protein
MSTAPAERAAWLEVIDTPSPILLIAPHGGRASAASRATLHPKVNDLHTADITRELAARLGASALINSGMDRNRLDCNRLPQLAEHAPWLLEMIAARLARIVERHRRATVLLIHGWNIIEPRVDLGLGVRSHGGELRPAGSARVSARDEFINGPLAALAGRLAAGGIKPTFGMRYPAGGAHNLVQAFTARHRESPIAALSRIASIAADGLVDAAQFELSVAVRMPGPLRAHCIGAMADSFNANGHAPEHQRAPLTIIRAPRARPAAPGTSAGAAAPAIPSRVGVEFFDPAAKIGAMASFDLGAGGIGARIMILLGPRRVVLFTAEGRPARDSSRVSLGPLSLAVAGGELELAFRGPAVLVPDGTTYVSIERALASGRLDPSVEVAVRMTLGPGGFDPERIFNPAAAPAPPAVASSFGTLVGSISIEGKSHPIRAAARAGMSFTGLGAQKFRARRMLWTLFDDGAAPSALELRSVAEDAPAVELRAARLLDHGVWSDGALHALDLDTPAVDAPPHRIAALLSANGEAPRRLSGSVSAFVPLSRPGPEQSRIYTALGFAAFRMGERTGAGMFEYSRRHDATAEMAPDEEEREAD